MLTNLRNFAPIPKSLRRRARRTAQERCRRTQNNNRMLEKIQKLLAEVEALQAHTAEEVEALRIK